MIEAFGDGKGLRARGGEAANESQRDQGEGEQLEHGHSAKTQRYYSKIRGAQHVAIVAD